jgi:hypothetical protein
MSAGSVPIPAAVAKRAALNYTVIDDHWISNYSVASHGYAQIGWQEPSGKMRGTTAHRAAWAHWNGDPGANTVDHHSTVCQERRCINPAHLRELSNLENSRRTNGRDWPLGQCINGHATEVHWRQPENGSKGYCRPCRAEVQRRYRIRKLGL